MTHPKPNLTEMGHCFHNVSLYIVDRLPIFLICCYCGMEVTWGTTYIPLQNHGPFAPRHEKLYKFLVELKECSEGGD